MLDPCGYGGDILHLHTDNGGQCGEDTDTLRDIKFHKGLLFISILRYYSILSIKKSNKISFFCKKMEKKFLLELYKCRNVCYNKGNFEKE